MRALAAAALVAAALALTLGAGAAQAASDYQVLGLQAYEPPKPAPGFRLPDLDGKPRSLQDYRGKALMLFFWATW